MWSFNKSSEKLKNGELEQVSVELGKASGKLEMARGQQGKVSCELGEASGELDKVYGDLVKAIGVLR